ncbi:peptidyl-tRNA hydrolase [candidate division MSBL1 archaeon SCGC-AAA382F02]|uniref:Peptidyl-tRNA hydrolase n=1 Tax=candidate division MSBL1 archaeon SCGC-AAA382F02 TaxID=1698282 RepID=A0A133VIZ5_9EURY|nr:peptidyl-tRNA hydrolase [candidate division MSBL1 archaeon SCGC-AAA382F02]
MFDYKQVMVIRTDLEMSPGKIAVQVAHASLSAAENAKTKNNKWFKNWWNEQQKKVVVKVSSEKELKTLKNKAEDLGIPNRLIKDAGLTELTPGTPTALGVGPGPNEEIDKVTGDLPLLGE